MKAWTAIERPSGLAAPLIGRWEPLVGIGDGVEPRQLLGHIHRAGKRVPVVAPEGSAKTVATVCFAGDFVEYGQAILELRTSGEARGDAETPGRSVPDGVIEILAPMSGTLYHQPSPGAPAFAPEGAQISPQSTLALVEVMKSLNPVRSAAPGCIEKWLVPDGEPIQAGQVLAWLRVRSTTS